MVNIESLRNITIIKVAALIILSMHILTAMYFASAFLVPVTVAFLSAFLFAPLVRALRRYRIPPPVSALLIVVMLVWALGSGLYALSGPVQEWINEAPQITRKLDRVLGGDNSPVKEVQEAARQVDEATNSDSSDAEKVVVQEPGLLDQAASAAPNLVASVGLALVLLIFLLASGDMFYEKLALALPTLTEKKRGIQMAQEVEQEVSRYLLTITVINGVLGVVIGLGMYFIGLPNPALWGAMAALLNFAPYVGPFIGIIVVALVSFSTFDSLGAMALGPAFYFVCNAIEGQFVTPALVGRRLRINPVSVFMAIAFWGWLWGAAGVLLAVPLLILVKVFAGHVEGFHWLSAILSEGHGGEHVRGLGGRAASDHHHEAE